MCAWGSWEEMRFTTGIRCIIKLLSSSVICIGTARAALNLFQTTANQAPNYWKITANSWQVGFVDLQLPRGFEAMPSFTGSRGKRSLYWTWKYIWRIESRRNRKKLGTRVAPSEISFERDFASKKKKLIPVTLNSSTTSDLDVDSSWPEFRFKWENL